MPRVIAFWAALLLLAPAPDSLALQESPALSSSRAVFSVLFYPTAVIMGSTAVGLSITRDSKESERRLLAQNALEDAAHFFASGEISGILPATLKRLRQTDASLAALSDPELVDAIASAAALATEAPASSP